MAHGDPDDQVNVPDFVSYLPERVWYLTHNGRDMWCRRPYSFFFTSGEAAAAFAAQMGTAFALSPIAVASKALVSSESVDALRRMEVTRIFVDPRIEPDSGDVVGTILRLAPMQ